MSSSQAIIAICVRRKSEYNVYMYIMINAINHEVNCRRVEGEDTRRIQLMFRESETLPIFWDPVEQQVRLTL